MDARNPSAALTRAPRFLPLLFLLLALLSSPLAAQNLLSNPSFDTALGLTAWNNYGSGNVADGARLHAPFPEDVNGVPSSGSARLSVTAAAALGTQIGLTQCVAVTAGQGYSYGSRIKMPNGQAPGAVRAFVEVEFFSNAACATPQNLGEGQGALIGTAYFLDDTVWRALPGTVPSTPGLATAPAGAQSAQVRLLVERAAAGTDAQALFDNPFFGIGIVPVELQRFEIGQTTPSDGRVRSAP